MSHDAQVQRSTDILQQIFRLIAAGTVDEAARLYSRCQEDVGFLLINKMPDNKKIQTALAKMFFVAKDFQKAALVFENAGDKERAAILYEKADDYLTAAEMYCQASKYAKGAAMFEKAGQYEQAAKFFEQEGLLERAAANFEKAINNYLAGRTYFNLGKYEKAMELLQKVEERDNTFLAATVMIGRILANQGFHDLAIRKFQAVVQNQGMTDETMEVYYELAILFQKLSRLDEARELFEKILTKKFGYKDVADRLKNLNESGVKVVEVVEEAAVIEDAAEHVEDAPAADESIVSMMDGIEFLKETPLFEELSLQEIKLFWTRFEQVQVPAGTVIIEQEVPGEAFFLLTSGSVVVERTNQGRVDTLATLGPGKFFGEMSLMDPDSVTSARVKAADVCQLLKMPRPKFTEMMDTYDRLALKVYRAFTRTLMDRLRSTNAALTNFKAQKDQELAKLFGG